MRRALAGLALCLSVLGSGCGGLNSAPAAPSVTLPKQAKLLPARMRRLTNLELERSWSALVGVNVALAAELPPDVRQEGYTPNAKQDVSSAWAMRYAQLSRDLAERAAERLVRQAPCPDAAQPSCL